MLRCSRALATLVAVVFCSSGHGAEPVRDGGSSQIPVLMPDAPGIPGRPRPEGLLCILGDDRLRLSGYPTRVLPTLDGARVFAVSMTNVVDVVDAKTMAVQESIRASDARVLEIATSPDGKRLAAAALDGTVTLWDVSASPARKLQQYTPFEGAEKKDYWLNLSTSWGRLRFCVSADAGATVYEWTPDGLKVVYRHGSELAFKPAVISPDGSRLVVRSKNPSGLQLHDPDKVFAPDDGRRSKNPGELHLVDLAASPGKVLDSLDRKLSGELVFKDDDEFLAASHGGSNDASYLVSIAGDKLKVLRTLNDVTADSFRSVQFLDQGRICVASHRTKGPVVFDCTKDNWEVMQAFEGTGLIGGATNGSALYAIQDQILISYPWVEKQFVVEQATRLADRALSRVEDLTFLRDGTLVFSTRSGVQAVTLGEPTRPRSLDPIRFKTPLTGESHLFPHPTAREFVILNGSPPSMVVVRDQGAGLEETQRFPFGMGPEAWKSSPWSAGYTPDGTTLAVGFWDQSIELYSNSADGLTLRSRTENAAGGHVCVLAFAPDSLLLACGDFGSNARLFAYDGDLRSHQTFPKFGDAVRHAQFSPDGGQLLLGSQNGEIRLINVAAKPATSRQLLLKGENEVSPTFNAGAGVSSMRWVADGKLLMTAKESIGETRVVLWKMPSGEPLQTWTFPGWMHAAINPDGFLVAVARADGVVCVMQVSEEVQRWLSDAP